MYLTSAELAAVGALLGKLPTPAEYLEYAVKIDSMADEIYRYMNFDRVLAFQKLAEDGQRIAATIIDEAASVPYTHMPLTPTPNVEGDGGER